MRKLLAGLAVVGLLAVASPAQAAVQSYEGWVLAGRPFVVEFPNTDGQVEVKADITFGGSDVTLIVTLHKQVLCKTGPIPPGSQPTCFIGQAPNGKYVATFTVADPDGHAFVKVTTDE